MNKISSAIDKLRRVMMKNFSNFKQIIMKLNNIQLESLISLFFCSKTHPS